MATAIAPPPGIYVPAVLFYDNDDELDLVAIKSHVLRLAKGGITGILVQGSNGEAQHLSHEERKLAIQTTRQTLDQNGFSHTVVLAGTGAQSTRETIKLCRDAKEAGATFALVLTPSTWVPQMTRENIINFHRKVADASPIPTMIYNFPVVTAGQDLDSDIISVLATHPNIVGTKLSCGNIGKLHRLTTTHTQSSFAVFAGRSDVFTQGLLSGSAGAIAALVNLLPKVHAHVYEVFKAGRIEDAMTLQGKLAHGDSAVSKAGGIAGLKGLITKHFGYGNGVVRGPLASAVEEKLRLAEEGKLIELIELEKSL
ncbi:dihydrodipicolinate synthetase [Rickenella mellea]|uniref:Dihydrodipicolinate synthetase n=1 Tax=Rickenella mellea TaxID=50990 RepID=A0A4Y7QFD3_9AGAM|nr:dihydrodipicolinate synthetase [Rickenella mellea]